MFVFLLNYVISCFPFYLPSGQPRLFNLQNNNEQYISDSSYVKRHKLQVNNINDQLDSTIIILLIFGSAHHVSGNHLPIFRSIIIINNNLDWGPVPHFCPLEALQPAWLTPEVYCTIPVFLIVPTMAARCLSHPQPAVVP
jgi:hypothetical protein